MEKKTKRQWNPVRVEANFVLVIAITGVVALVLNLITLILLTTNHAQEAEITNWIAFPASIAEIVFIILNFTKWTAIRDYTKINYHCVTTAYIIPLAIVVALGILSRTPLPYVGHVVIITLAAVIDLYVVIYSFILQYKVATYINK